MKNIKIVDERIKEVEFGDIDVGECFVFDKRIWVKIDFYSDDINHNAVVLNNGSGGINNQKLFHKNTVVLPVELEIHIVR